MVAQLAISCWFLLFDQDYVYLQHSLKCIQVVRAKERLEQELNETQQKTEEIGDKT